MNQETSQFKKLVAVYGRVSTSTQENEGTIETQLLAVREHAEKHGYSIVREYLDEGWSGDTLVRPNLDQLRMDAKKKLWEAVLIFDPDRLARRFSYQELVSDELREAGIEVMFVTTPTPTNSEDRILFGVKGLFAEYERSKIAERFRLGKVRKAKEGHIIASEAPYGYTYVARKGNKGESGFKEGYYEVNEVEASVVKSIFSWVADDRLSLRAVIGKLKDLGIPPRKSKRGVWSTSTLSNMFKNRTYIGEGFYGKHYGVVPENPTSKNVYRKIKKTSRKQRPEEDWISIPTPQIIPEKLFNRASKRLQKNFEQSIRNTKNEYLLSGRIWCTCDSRRTGEGPQNGKYLYYRCSNRINNFPLPPTCLEGGINARIADKLVWNEISQLMSSPSLLFKQAERFYVEPNREVTGPTINIQATQAEITKLKEREARFTNAYGDGVLSIEKFKELVLPVRERAAILENQVSKAKDEVQPKAKQSLPNYSDIEEFTNVISNRLGDLSFDDKKAILDDTTCKIVGTQEGLLISGYISIQNHVEYCSIYRYDTNAIKHTKDSKNIISFKIELSLPPPLQRGVDYGFIKK
ncbi:MAG: recombinase family protein [Flavobacteriales bacterium]|nr:recombinase family protein [Flavobacteriales bacterium]